MAAKAEKAEKKKVELKKRLARLLRNSDNKICADCPEKRPGWISFIQPQQSFALGSKVLASFVCLECAECHKKLGTDICYVRSIKEDEFKKDEIEHAQHSGNGIINEIFEGHLRKSTTDEIGIKPLMDADVSKKERYIRSKYVDLYFYRKSAHYKQIADMNEVLAESRKTKTKKKEKKSSKPAGKKRRKSKELGAFLGEKMNDSKESRCSLTVGNTVSTPISNDDGNHFSGSINVENSEDELTLVTDQGSSMGEPQDARTIKRGRSRRKLGKKSISELDIRQTPNRKSRSPGRTQRDRSRGRRGRSGSRSRSSKNNEKNTTFKDDNRNRERSKSRRRSLSEGASGESQGKSRRRSLSQGSTSEVRSKTRRRSLSQGSTSEIREKGHRSSVLRRERSRSRSQSRTRRKSDSSKTEDVSEWLHSQSADELLASLSITDLVLDNLGSPTRDTKKKARSKGRRTSEGLSSSMDYLETPARDENKKAKIRQRNTSEDAKTTRDNANLEQNSEESIDDNGFKLIDSSTFCTKRSSFGNSWNSSGSSFTKPYKKKGVGLFHNRQGQSVEFEGSTTIRHNRRERKSAIFASLERESSCEHFEALNDHNSDSFEWETLQRSSNSDNSGSFVRAAPRRSRSSDTLMRVAPRRTRSSDAIGMQSSSSKMRGVSMKSRSVPIRSRSSATVPKTTLKMPEWKTYKSRTSIKNETKLLKEEWEKLKKENEDVFVSFEKSFSKF